MDHKNRWSRSRIANARRGGRGFKIRNKIDRCGYLPRRAGRSPTGHRSRVAPNGPWSALKIFGVSHVQGVGVVVISSSGRRSHTGPDVPGQAVVRVYMCPGELPRAPVVLRAHDGLTRCGWSGVPCGGRRGDDRSGPQPLRMAGAAGPPSPRRAGVWGRAPRSSALHPCVVVQLAVVRLPRAQSRLRLAGCSSWSRRSLG